MEKSGGIAKANMETRFKDNPCRGIVLGLNDRKNLVLLSWIMGRSENSKNRIYVIDGETVKTEAADPSKVKDPRLIIYNAMRNSKSGKQMIVSNGDQTDTIYDTLNKEGKFAPEDAFNMALRSRFCEPDAPNFTPRISGLVEVQQNDPNWANIYISILKNSPAAREKWLTTVEKGDVKKENFKDNDLYNAAIGKACAMDCLRFPTIRQTYELPVAPGFGYCITTYKPGSKTLDSFEGEPFVVPMLGDVEDIMNTFWGVLEPEWRVSLAGKICEKGKIKVGAPINAMKKV